MQPTLPHRPLAFSFLLEFKGTRIDRWFYVNVQGSPQAPSDGALYTKFSIVVDLADVVLLPDGLARIATSPLEAQACRIWTIRVRAKILLGMVTKDS